MKKYLFYFILVAMLLILAGCGKGGESSGNDAAISSAEGQGGKTSCTISISCAVILEHMDQLEKGKEAFVPSDGWILEPMEVDIAEGDSVFDVLLAVCREQKIHMEHSYTPLYGSEYIEGIQQLYEFDCGKLSGWTYCVDGTFPNYGCDKYKLSGGEQVQWLYTCDLGKDVGENMEEEGM